MRMWERERVRAGVCVLEVIRKTLNEVVYLFPCSLNTVNFCGVFYKALRAHSRCGRFIYKKIFAYTEYTAC